MKKFKKFAAFLMSATMLASVVPTGFAAWTSESGDFGIHRDGVQWYDFNTFKSGEVSSDFVQLTKSDSGADEASVIIQDDGGENVLSLQTKDASVAPATDGGAWDGVNRNTVRDLHFDKEVDFSNGSVTIQFTMKRGASRTAVQLLGEDDNGADIVGNLIYNNAYGDGIRFASGGNTSSRISYADARDYYYDYKFVIGDVLESAESKRTIEVYYRKNGVSAWTDAQAGQSSYTFTSTDNNSSTDNDKMTKIKGLKISTYSGYAALYNNVKNGKTTKDSYNANVPECAPGNIFSAEFKNIAISVPEQTSFEDITSLSFDDYPAGYLGMDSRISHTSSGHFKTAVSLADESVGKVLNISPTKQQSDYSSAVSCKSTTELDLGSNIDLTKGETTIDITAKFPKVKFWLSIGDSAKKLGLQAETNVATQVRVKGAASNAQTGWAKLMDLSTASGDYYTYRFVVSDDGSSYKVLYRKYGEAGAFTEWTADTNCTTDGLSSFGSISFYYEINSSNWDQLDWQGWSIKEIKVKQKTPFNGSRSWDFSGYTTDDVSDFVKISKNDSGKAKAVIEDGILKLKANESASTNWSHLFDFCFGDDISYENGPITVEIEAKPSNIKSQMYMRGKAGETEKNDTYIGLLDRDSGKWYSNTANVPFQGNVRSALAIDKDVFCTYTFIISDKTYTQGETVYRPYELWITDENGVKNQVYGSEIQRFGQDMNSKSDIDSLSGIRIEHKTAGTGADCAFEIKKVSVSQGNPTVLFTGLDKMVIRRNITNSADKQKYLAANLGNAYVEGSSDKANISVKLTNAENTALSGTLIVVIRDDEERFISTAFQDVAIPAGSSEIIEGFQFDVTEDSTNWKAEAYLWDMTEDKLKPLTNKIVR